MPVAAAAAFTLVAALWGTAGNYGGDYFRPPPHHALFGSPWRRIPVGWVEFESGSARFGGAAAKFISPQARPRYSLPFFLHYKPDYVIEPCGGGSAQNCSVHRTLLPPTVRCCTPTTWRTPAQPAPPLTPFFSLYIPPAAPRSM